MNRLNTGNRDMNNRPIYEGDVVKSRLGMCLIIYKNERFYAEHVSDKIQYAIADLDFRTTEVIGSIYDSRYMLDMVQDSFAMWQHHYLKEVKTFLKDYKQAYIDRGGDLKTFHNLTRLAHDLDEVEAHSLKLLNQNNFYKQALDEIEKYLDAQQKYFDGEEYHNLLDIINKAKEGNDDR